MEDEITMDELDFQASKLQVDEAIDAYVDWREECVSVSEAYELWADTPAGEAGLAFAAYRAALDREERASQTYAYRLMGMASLDVDQVAS
jgi:hypothetical protein